MTTTWPPAPEASGPDDARPDEARIAAALAVFRAECRSTPVASRLAERVLAAAARGDLEASRFSRVARVYAAAAAVLAVVGIAGSVLVRNGAESTITQARSPLVDVEEAGILHEGSQSALDLAV